MLVYVCCPRHSTISLIPPELALLDNFHQVHAFNEVHLVHFSMKIAHGRNVTNSWAPKY